MSSWALVIKLCDRLDNVSDLIELKDEKFVDKYVNETIEIMNYLLKNAKLSKTHMNIIERILYTLILLGKNDVNKISRISEVLDMYYKLKENKNSVDETLSELAKIANNSEEKNKVKQKNKKN